MGIWFCKEHYDSACAAAGHEIEVYALPNWFHWPCAVCEKEANHLIPVSTIDPDNLIPLLIEGYRKATKCD
jgi:hypothetical protein